ncbi:MAG: hypothetical protein WBR26_21310 [Candidatus Acidiferrum sp.]
MSAYFKIDKERRLVISTLSGAFTLADGLAHQERLLKDLDFNPNFSQLLDCTQITKVELKPEDVRRLAQRSIFSSDSHRAILVGSDLLFGLARMFMIFRETLGEKGIRIFYNRDEALYWVRPGHSAD